MTEVTRRTLIAGSAVTAVATAMCGVPSGSGKAATPPVGKQTAGLYRYKLGDLELTALNDGTWYRPIDEKFVGNVPFAQVQKVLTDSFLPADKLPIPFTTLLVNTGRQLVL